VLPLALETPKQKLSLCGRCHGDYTVNDKPFAEGLEPGGDLFALPGFKLNEITTPGPFQQLNELESSKHGEHDVTCLSCHTSHETTAAAPQLRKAVPDLCLECHTDAHKCTVAADKVTEGATCATCHMPGGRHIFKVVK
jgi:predicted CXXCH cytochrome family protein